MEICYYTHLPVAMINSAKYGVLIGCLRTIVFGYNAHYVNLWERKDLRSSLALGSITLGGVISNVVVSNYAVANSDRPGRIDEEQNLIYCVLTTGIASIGCFGLSNMVGMRASSLALRYLKTIILR